MWAPKPVWTLLKITNSSPYQDSKSDGSFSADNAAQNVADTKEFMFILSRIPQIYKFAECSEIVIMKCPVRTVMCRGASV
jgi:hypothetical protein